MRTDAITPAAALDATGDRARSAFEVVVWALSLAGLLTFAATIAARAGFAWPLEWMEGASLQHAQRLLHGRALYAAPSAEFIPYLYPPLAYVPMAISSALFGPVLPAARVASIACTLGSLLLIGRSAARAGGACAGIAAAALFAVGFGYAGAFVDLARVDACFVLLWLLGVERLLAQRPRAALAFLALSVFAKQHGLLLLAAASLSLLSKDARRHRATVIAALAGVAVAFIALQLASAGWFGRYAFALPSKQPMSWTLLASFVVIDLCVYLPVLSAAAAYDLARRAAARTLVPFDAVLIAAVIAGALGRAHAGGHDNVRLPALALLCIAGVVPLWRACSDSTRALPLRVAACAALCLQFAMLWQPPGAHAPPPESAAQFHALRAALDRCSHGGTSVALDYAGLGSQPFLHTMALSDLRLAGEDERVSQLGTEALLRALRSPGAPRALAVGEHFAALDRVLSERYRECARVPAPQLATGYRPGFREGAARWQVVYARPLDTAVAP